MRKRKERHIGKRQSRVQRLKLRRKKPRAVWDARRIRDKLVPPSYRMQCKAKARQMMFDEIKKDKEKEADRIMKLMKLAG